MGRFTVQLQDFAKKAKDNADILVGGVTVRIAQRLDERSPVGDAAYWKSKPPKGYVGGRFRGNWQLGVGSVPSGETGIIDTGGGVALGRIIAEVPEKASGQVFFLANNSPYGQRLEEGWSRQAPQGLVALTAMEFETFVREAAEKLP